MNNEQEIELQTLPNIEFRLYFDNNNVESESISRFSLDNALRNSVVIKYIVFEGDDEFKYSGTMLVKRDGKVLDRIVFPLHFERFFANGSKVSTEVKSFDFNGHDIDLEIINETLFRKPTIFRVYYEIS